MSFRDMFDMERRQLDLEGELDLCWNDLNLELAKGEPSRKRIDQIFDDIIRFTDQIDDLEHRLSSANSYDDMALTA
jgi:hypothetical protein